MTSTGGKQAETGCYRLFLHDQIPVYTYDTIAQIQAFPSLFQSSWILRNDFFRLWQKEKRKKKRKNHCAGISIFINIFISILISKFISIFIIQTTDNGNFAQSNQFRRKTHHIFWTSKNRKAVGGREGRPVCLFVYVVGDVAVLVFRFSLRHFWFVSVVVFLVLVAAFGFFSVVASFFFLWPLFGFIVF